MKEIHLTIIAESPLAIGRKKPGGSISEAQDYISGTVIRGAIAKKIIQIGGEPQPEQNDDFHQLFISDEAAIFRNAYPAPNVLPATAVSSKTNPGFKDEKEQKHGVFDTLIDRFCAEAYGQPYDPSCPVDKGRVEPYSGYYDIDQNGKYQVNSVNKRLLTRSGINRRRATTEEEILYSIEVINEKDKKKDQQEFKPVVYQSSILLENEDLSKSLEQFINHYSSDFRLGGATSRGLGKVQLQANTVESNFDLASQIKNFNQALQKRWKLWQIFGEPKEDLITNKMYFTLNLQSNAILQENWMRTTVITEKMLQQVSDFKDESLKLHVAYSSYDYLSGWNTAWGLMKDIELITNKGGVYLFSTENIVSWLPKLQGLSIKGVGDRIIEGFGQIKICDPFHLVFREDAK